MRIRQSTSLKRWFRKPLEKENQIKEPGICSKFFTWFGNNPILLTVCALVGTFAAAYPIFYSMVDYHFLAVTITPKIKITNKDASFFLLFHNSGHYCPV